MPFLGRIKTRTYSNSRNSLLLFRLFLTAKFSVTIAFFFVDGHRKMLKNYAILVTLLSVFLFKNFTETKR